MKIMICGNVFGDFKQLKEDASFIEANNILICGNVGIKTDTRFIDYWEGDLDINVPIRFITGKHEDFGLLKEVIRDRCLYGGRPDIWPVDSMGKCLLKHEEESIPIAGVSGTYSEKYYEEPTAPRRHMQASSLELVPKNLDIVLLHNVPGKIGKQSGLNFDMRFFDFLKQKQARYVFVGGYGFPNYSYFPCGRTTVLFLPPLKRGYAILDTTDWSCYFNNRM